MLNPINWLTALALGLIVYGAVIVARPAWFQRAPVEQRMAAGEAACRGTRGVVTAPVASDRHYWVEVTFFRRWYGGTRVRMLADSGATQTTLAHEDARRLGWPSHDVRYSVPLSTANGVVGAAIWRMPMLHIGELCFWQPTVLVAAPGTLDTSLLGMDIINAVRSFRIEQGRLSLDRS